MVTRPSQINFIQSPEEIKDGVRKQLEQRFIKMLRIITIKNIMRKLEA